MREELKIFWKRLREILPEDCYVEAVKTFSCEKVLSARTNTLKVKQPMFFQLLKQQGIKFSRVSWFKDALIFNNFSLTKRRNVDIFEEGLVYQQGLSSMLVPLILDPRPGEKVLDICAAPGSKTTQMAAMMNNQGSILSIESVPKRFYKLKSVVSLLGATNVSCKLMDGRRYRLKGGQSFDKVLLDAPCSSEGRFCLSNRKTYAYWSLRKIQEMQRKQKGLLLNASRLLKPNGVLVYSTCTFSPEENEAVIDWILKKTFGALKIMSVSLEKIFTYPTVTKWKGVTFDHQVKNCLRILPTKKMHGFFIAKLIRV